jgi:hypothetical protein
MAIYYDVYKPPRGDGVARMVYLRKELIPKIRFDDLKLSLELRCAENARLSKPDMMDMLYKVRPSRSSQVTAWCPRAHGHGTTPNGDALRTDRDPLWCFAYGRTSHSRGRYWGRKPIAGSRSWSYRCARKPHRAWRCQAD